MFFFIYFVHLILFPLQVVSENTILCIDDCLLLLYLIEVNFLVIVTTLQFIELDLLTINVILYSFPLKFCLVNSILVISHE